ncbi:MULTISPECIES: 2Fe-2S iron-sulfur cluster-binding protein [unclassified Novosphingobium]|uniref:2Fe-2S iron-sulfur cluster-binding protein n=2 Tax=Novosphingobium TaxID=165696 RepID=UPI000D2FCFFD|nr:MULTISPECIES: 2Fe-2S iron-sulfur cluster-binding protein [unclassified Novosphingobium]PTR10880.1 sarcosine oxidase subunit alpha [Novosphingobium sp. GV055]PUB03430.1 sarcosine oxidase subunit alpha [Novosphingobium sp. GV061]PUB19885.1 sarcosine oxidase subunit alpha [Novosphingobium sp. GV079]PUB41646.1 sarcosine oxidase subunit alpha [Novosphingobium sp. GV027]
MSGYRLPAGGRVNRAAPLDFTFDGRAHRGFAGDSLASALVASGQMLFGRSFKYHRPRGILGMGTEEPNALVTVDRGGAGPGWGRRTPNLRAPSVPLYQGLTAQSQNRYPSLKFDLGAVNDRLGAFFPAGFYNKTFMWPRSAWEKLYEPAIRRMAGLGASPTERDPDHYDATYAHCEVLVVGGGLAGIDAALAAAADGGRVILIDEQDELGGGALSDQALWGEVADKAMALRRLGNVTVLTRTTAFGYYHQNFVGAVEQLTDHLAPAQASGARERLWRIRAGEVILAQGAIERPLVFDGNDVPGVMLSSAGRTLAVRYGVAVGRAVAVMAVHDSGWRDALALKAAGVNVVAVIDLRGEVAADLVAAVRGAGIAVHLGHAVTQVAGRHGVTGVTFAPGGTGQGQQLAVDALLMAGGWTPTVHLWSHAKGSLRWDNAWGAYLPDVAQENCRAVGAGAGAWDMGAGLALGTLPGPKPIWQTKAFVDFQNDVKARDIDLAVREGMRSIEHIKRYTTNGMATDQGKTSNLNGLQIASGSLAKPVTDIGLTTFRPPYTPQTFGALMGHHKDALFQPIRKTVIDGWADARGAVFENVAQWRRARYFPQGGEDMRAAVARECLAVRQQVGMFDASTLGKIEVVGPDAAEFLNRMYTNPWKALAPGRCRYGLLLREDGFITDDGVSARLAPDRFHLTTTTGGAARVLAMMEDYLQTEWSDLDVWLTSTTEQWAVIAVQGPLARAVIAPLVEGIDLAPGAFPHMAIREGRICGVPTRLFRVSFTGELGYEVNVPAEHGRMVWEAIHASGQAHGITPYGTETMHVLRAEKGYVIVGQDTDGTLTPDDAGMAWAVGTKKPDFVGKRSLARPDMSAPGRKQLVGLLTEDPQEVLEEGAQIVADPDQPVPMTMLGHVTSSYHSATLGRSIAMAVIADGRARDGQVIHVPMPGRTIRARVSASTVFYDPQGSRLDV